MWTTASNGKAGLPGLWKVWVGQNAHPTDINGVGVKMLTHINQSEADVYGGKSPDIQNCSLIVSVPVASGDYCRLMDWTRLKLSA